MDSFHNRISPILEETGSSQSSPGSEENNKLGLVYTNITNNDLADLILSTIL